MIYDARDGNTAYVNIMWGGGIVGNSGFKIGPTNFVCDDEKLQDGVYFWTTR